MKKFIMIAICSLSINAFANEGSKFFQSTGTAECDTDCFSATLEAQAEATTRAQESCGSLEANQVSEWNVRNSFGLIRVTATFKCGQAGQKKDYFSSTGTAECELSCLDDSLEAQAEAIARAQELCGSLVATRVSEWTTKVTGYGRLSSTAIFICEDAN